MPPRPRLLALGLMAAASAFANPTYPLSRITNASGQAWVLSIDDLLVPVGLVRIWNSSQDVAFATLVSTKDKFTLKPRYSYYIEVCPSPKVLNKGVALTLGFHAQQTRMSDFTVNVKQGFSTSNGRLTATAPRLVVGATKGATINVAGFQNEGQTFIELH
ncbi:hypothetical protein [Mesoterricola sediminis]|uniref:Uncharacterized protein n=1 Tax=Mesoterricola sediminis TaxID=2927980 RepID=A0AA48KEU3_9BACT|nr:hypothetical protein [Mesoterricola sediminis]BDU75803.1 hypothetical protein METESE_07610 [Mesoterricola sediminis]